MKTFNLDDHSHRRLNILTGEWVQVSPHRAKRPWQGQVEKQQKDMRPEYDEGCYLCPGNIRAGGKQNPDYTSTYVFENDFAALQSDAPDGEFNIDDLLVAKSEKGVCKVICFSPKHNLTLPEMSVEEITTVVALWTEQYKEIGSLPYINYVQIFENKGEVMGCSNPHPHGQIWAQETIPGEPARELIQFEKYYKKNSRTLLQDYLDIELREKTRILFENEHFVVLVPFWAVWPFETMILSKEPIQNLTQFSKQMQHAFAEAIRHLTIKYDNLFGISFPYSAGIHQSPTDGKSHDEWHFHMHFYPPLLRSSTIKKFMVGYEMLGNPQRDITPESSADRLRSLPNIHYKAES